MLVVVAFTVAFWTASLVKVKIAVAFRNWHRIEVGAITVVLGVVVVGIDIDLQLTPVTDPVLRQDALNRQLCTTYWL